jgi:mRNA-degrading endonuclease RelE of RelBE toxin-antitoxin system
MGGVSASEIIKELPKLSDAERRSILDKLRELAQVDDDRWKEIINEPANNRAKSQEDFYVHLNIKTGGRKRGQTFFASPV